MLSTAQFASNIFAPVMAAVLLGIIGIAGILAIDMFTFLIAIGALLAVHVPQPVMTQEGQRSKGSLWKESVYGFRYIRERPSLLALLLVFFGVNLLAPFAFTLLSPMILARTGNDATALGMVQSAIGVGGLVGGVVLSIWGGPKRKIHGILVGLILVTLGVMLIGLGWNPLIWALVAFYMMFFLPIINGSSQAIWQAKVAPDVQGRVFAARGMIAQVGAPVAMLLAGPLADYVFEPAMMSGGSWAPLFGWLVGTGPGAGMSLMFVIAGALAMLVGLGGYAIPIVRNVEDILPDHVVEFEPSDKPASESFPDKSNS
jgi:predicted MFS family arabinose efflux permease